MELGAGKDYLAVLCIELGQCMQVLQCSLSHQVVRVRDKGHQDMQGRLESDLVVIVDDQSLEHRVW